MRHSKLVLFAITIILLFSVPTASAISQTPTWSSPCGETFEPGTQDPLSSGSAISAEDIPLCPSGNLPATPQLFNMNVNALAYPYLGEQLMSFGYEQGTSLTDHSYSAYMSFQSKERAIRQWIGENSNGLLSQDKDIAVIDQSYSWKNKVVTIPGHGPNADEIV